MQGQLSNFVVENAESSVVASVSDHFEMRTDAAGLADVWLPPGAVAYMQCLPHAPSGHSQSFEADESEQRITVSSEKEQFVAFELHQTARLRVRIQQFGSDTPIVGAVVLFSMMEDERGEQDGVHFRRESLETDAAGETPWFMGRAGMLIRASLVSLPHEYLPMRDLDHLLDQLQSMRLTGDHVLKWQVPRKPRVDVRVHDAASGERIIGVQFRVMCRPHAALPPHPRVSFGGAKLLDMEQVRLCCYSRLDERACVSCGHWLPLHVLEWQVPKKPRVEVRMHDASSGSSGCSSGSCAARMRVSFGGA
jgi:hypothetical protein